MNLDYDIKVIEINGCDYIVTAENQKTNTMIIQRHKTDKPFPQIGNTFENYVIEKVNIIKQTNKHDELEIKII